MSASDWSTPSASTTGRRSGRRSSCSPEPAALTYPDDYRDLKGADADLRRRGLVIVEGARSIESLLRSTLHVRSIAVTGAKRAAMGSVLDAAEARGIAVHVVPVDELRAVSGFDIHRGAIASAQRPAPVAAADVVKAAAGRTVAVLEGISDVENVGAVFRNAAAFGIAGVLLDGTSADPLSRRVVRVSLGHVLHVPWARWTALTDLRDASYTIAALTPAGDVALPSWLPGGGVAFVLGAEGAGLSQATLDAADVCVRIPMAPAIDSINIATAAAIAFAHVFHARH